MPIPRLLAMANLNLMYTDLERLESAYNALWVTERSRWMLFQAFERLEVSCMSKKEQPVEGGLDLICPHCEAAIEKVDAVSRQWSRRGPLGMPISVIALACPTCHKVLGFVKGFP